MTGDAPKATISDHQRPSATISDQTNTRIAIAVAQWHSAITNQMLESAVKVAEAHNATVSIHKVSGSAELPVVAQHLTSSHDAVVALGVIIQGETAHFEHVSRTVWDGLAQVALDQQTPIAIGVLTVYQESQALQRAGGTGAQQDAGADAMTAALSTLTALNIATRRQYLT